jgi:hypothetical protein
MSEPIVLTAGFSGYISIQDQNAVELFHREINSPQEGQGFLNDYGQSVDGWSTCEFSFIPIRTDNWCDFAKDLFLPTFINGALRIDHLICRIFVSIFAIAIDLVTLASRLVTAPFRAIYNCANKSEHPIIPLIANHDDTQDALEKGLVEIIIFGKQITISQGVEGSEEFSSATETSKKVNLLVVTKELPAIQEKKMTETVIRTYEGYQGEWTVNNSYTSSDSQSRFAF